MIALSDLLAPVTREALIAAGSPPHLAGMLAEHYAEMSRRVSACFLDTTWDYDEGAKTMTNRAITIEAGAINIAAGGVDEITKEALADILERVALGVDPAIGPDRTAVVIGTANKARAYATVEDIRAAFGPPPDLAKVEAIMREADANITRAIAGTFDLEGRGSSYAAARVHDEVARAMFDPKRQTYAAPTTERPYVTARCGECGSESTCRDDWSGTTIVHKAKCSRSAGPGIWRMYHPTLGPIDFADVQSGDPDRVNDFPDRVSWWMYFCPSLTREEAHQIAAAASTIHPSHGVDVLRAFVCAELQRIRGKAPKDKQRAEPSPVWHMNPAPGQQVKPFAWVPREAQPRTLAWVKSIAGDGFVAEQDSECGEVLVTLPAGTTEARRSEVCRRLRNEGFGHVAYNVEVAPTLATCDTCGRANDKHTPKCARVPSLIRDLEREERRAREAPLVALVNACPEGLDPIGWRAAVLAVGETADDFDGTAVELWNGHRCSAAVRLFTEGSRSAPDSEAVAWSMRDVAVDAYRRALTPARKVAPERRERGPVIVCDAGWEDLPDAS